jgi:hypothetical protein
VTGPAVLALVLAAHSWAISRYDVEAPSVVRILAIIRHESGGNERACADEPDGSSSRGFMMIRRPHSRCAPEDDARFAADYDPAANIREGIARLVAARRYERRHRCHRRVGYLVHYAGAGPAAERAAREIQALERRIRRKGVKAWKTA